MENLVAEKNDLSLSFLHHSLPSDQDDEVSESSSNQVFHLDGTFISFSYVPKTIQVIYSHYSITLKEMGRKKGIHRIIKVNKRIVVCNLYGRQESI